MRSRVLVIGSKGTEDGGQRTEDTFANSPFGLIIEATQALHIPWTLVGPLMGLGGPWMGPGLALSVTLGGPWVAMAGFKFVWGPSASGGF